MPRASQHLALHTALQPAGLSSPTQSCGVDGGLAITYKNSWLAVPGPGHRLLEWLVGSEERDQDGVSRLHLEGSNASLPHCGSEDHYTCGRAWLAPGLSSGALLHG